MPVQSHCSPRAALLLLPVLLLLACNPLRAQEDPVEVEPDVSARELIESKQVEEKLVEEIKESESTGGPSQSSPLKTMVALREAARAKDYTGAAEYLDMRYLPEELDGHTPEGLLKALSYVFSRQNIINLSDLSDNPRGRQNDGLPEFRDKIGEVVLVDETIPIYLQRIPDGKGGRVWKISNATVAKIPTMWDELGYSEIAIWLSQWLPDTKFMGMDNWQWFATALFIIIAWPLATIFCAILARLVLLVYDRFPLATTNFIRGPLRFFLFILIARYLINQLGLSLTARILLESSGVDYIAFTVLLLGVISFIRDYQMRKMQRAGNIQYVALLKPFTTIAKVVLITIIALFWADSAGYNMSTVLAGLGVGSLAVALAAQKTLENVIGAATLYAARPVRAGDFCRFGDVVGTVEEIGLRSTVLRTLNRTLVIIPNSVFSSTGVENFTARDRIRYYRRFRLRLGTGDQLRYILAQVRATLSAHPRLQQDTVSVRFETIEDATAWLRLDAGVDTTDYQDFLAVAEDLNLRIVDIVEQAGSAFAGPGRLLHDQELPRPGGSGELVEQTLREWREQDRLPFPDYSEEELAQLKASLDYPPKGSPG